MARYDWDKLKAKYISGDYSSLKEFSEIENINYDVLRRKASKWQEEKSQSSHKKVTKIIDKTIEKVAEQEADRNAKILSISDKLAAKVDEAINQLEQYVVKNKKKTKTVEYDKKGLKPTKEITTEEEIIDIIDGLIDKQGLKTLTAALKDIKDINTDKLLIETNNTTNGSINVKFEGVLDEWSR